jgi:hypothetical protein
MPRRKKEATAGRTRTVVRSAVTGRFVKKTAAKRRPDITVLDEVSLPSNDEIEIVRSTRTGRFVKSSTAKRHPATTVKEVVKR